MSTVKFNEITNIEFKHVESKHAKNNNNTPQFEQAVNDYWDKMLKNNPTLFNGPVVNPITLKINGDVCTIEWSHSDFAHYLYSRSNSQEFPEQLIGSIFVSLFLYTENESFVVGQMSSNTASPGIIQLPGGGLEISQEQTTVQESDLRLAVLKETIEEIGITLCSDMIKLRGVIERSSPIDIGLVYSCSSLSWKDISSAFTTLKTLNQRAGKTSEFTRILKINSIQDATEKLTSNLTVVDYLPIVMNTLLRK